MQSCRRPLLCRALCVSVVVLAACGPAPEAQSQARVQPDSESCTHHPLVGVLPSVSAVNGLSRQQPQCDWLSAAVTYARGDDTCTVTITDMQAPIPEQLQTPGILEISQATLQLAQNNHRVVVAMQTGHRKLMLEGDPMFLEMSGGEDHLAVVGQLAGGEPYVIPVPLMDERPDGVHLTALTPDERYGVQVSCSMEVADAPAARALYAPWIPLLDLRALR